MQLSSVSTRELFELLKAAIDGIDGYESENGDLRYWDSAKIDKARSLLGTVRGGVVPVKAAAIAP